MNGRRSGRCVGTVCGGARWVGASCWLWVYLAEGDPEASVDGGVLRAVRCRVCFSLGTHTFPSRTQRVHGKP